LLAGRPFPDAAAYDGFPQHENGVGMARTFELELLGHKDSGTGVHAGFFAWVDGAPAEGYRAPRTNGKHTSATTGPTAIITGEYGARVLAPLLEQAGRRDVRVLPVRNEFFGGNIAVTGLLVGEDIARVLDAQPHGDRYLLPDVCLSKGAFLDGTTPADLPRPVEVVPTDGVALRQVLGL
jgi:NifB/MoaA-like Fe-S oxidoreductase